MLGLKEGDTAAVLSTTLGGQANALDVVISDVFSTGNAATEDKFMFFPLKHAQMLTDAAGMADRLTLLQAQGMPSAQDIAQLSRLLAQAGLDVDIHTWQELSGFYRQVRAMFDMIFGFLLVIVLTIVVMSMTNAMCMSVVERTKEIGTLRAIGMQRMGVIRLFVTEALLLVIAGCVLGLALAMLVRLGVNMVDLSYQPPNATESVPLLIGLDISKNLIVVIILSGLSLVSAFFPARRAAHQPVIDSLAHV